MAIARMHKVFKPRLVWKIKALISRIWKLDSFEQQKRDPKGKLTNRFDQLQSQEFEY